MKASKSLPYGWVVLTLLVFSLAGWVPLAGRAEDVRDTSSLKFVPEDVAFYSTSLRLREQYEAFAGSKAFAAIRNMPAVQAGVGFLRLMWEGGQYEQAAAVKAFLEQEENKPLIEMLGDACSHEIFLFGGKGYGGLARLVNEVNRVQRQAQITALREGGEAERIMAELLLETLTKSLDNAKLPDTVVGFRISDAQRAKDQLARLETLLKELLARTPELQPFQDRLTRETVAGAEYLTLKLDGGLIPWDKVYEEVEDQRAKLEQLAAKIKPMTLVVQIGVWNDYLLISLGDSSEHLAALGHGPRLADRKEFKPLAKYADRPIVSIGYADEGFMREAGAVSQQVDELVGLAEQLLPLAQLDDSVEQELMQDVRAMTESIKKHIPQPGAQFGVSFLTPRGYEGFGYNWAENPLIDASQKLSILRHVGSNPIFLFATRSKYDPKCYDGVATCVARAVYYAEKIGLPKLPDADRAKYEKLRDQLLPLVKKMDQVTREVLVPAMQDGQMAVVLDAQSTSTQWHQDMPLSQQPLPMLELAVLYGVSDKEAVKKAGGEYFAILQQVLDELHAAQPEEVPEMKLPRPDQKEFPAGTIYFYALPQSVGLDKQIAPGVGLSQEVLGFSLLPRYLQRLLETSSLSAGGPLADLERPLGAVTYLNWAALLDAVSPWVDFGFQVAQAEQENPMLAATKSQVVTVLIVLKCFRGVGQVTYFEDGAWISHFEVHLEDLP